MDIIFNIIYQLLNYEWKKSGCLTFSSSRSSVHTPTLICFSPLSYISALFSPTTWKTLLCLVHHLTLLLTDTNLSSIDASAAMQVRALKDYCNNYDLTSLNIKAGDIITVHRYINVCRMCWMCVSSNQSMKNMWCCQYVCTGIGICHLWAPDQKEVWGCIQASFMIRSRGIKIFLAKGENA